MIQKTNSAAQFISVKFEDIKRKHPRLSLRAISIKAGISPGRLSEIMSGKRKLSSYYADKICGAMKLTQIERNQLFSFVEVASRKQVSSRTLLEKEIALITGWENYAILSLMKTKDFQSDPEWIAERLGISSAKVNQAIETMESLAIIRRSESGYVRTSEEVHTTTDIPSRHLRQVHHIELAKALEVLENTSVQIRSFSSATMSIDVNRLPEAKKMISDFQNSLMQYLEQGETTEVYNFNMQLFPLTNMRGRG